MALSRRSFLTLASAVPVSLVAGAPTLGAGIVAPTPQRVARLAPWGHGTSSSSTETVLMFRGDPLHTFGGTGPIPERAPTVAWSYRTPARPSMLRGQRVVWAGMGWTGSAVKLGDYVYVGSVCGEAYAFEAATGALVWKAQAGGFFKSSFCAYENRLYIGNTDNLLRCIDAQTGRTLWRHDTGNDLDSSPCVVNGKLYISGENGNVRCLDPLTGVQIWKTFVGGIGPGTESGSNGSETSPAIADGVLYGGTFDGKLYALDTETGKRRWEVSTGDDTDASVAIAGEFLYAGAQERAPILYCFARSNGHEVWRYTGNSKGYWSTPTVAAGRVHVGGEDGSLHTLDAQTGAPLWTFKTGDGVWSSPSVVDGKVIFGSRDFHLYCLDAATGKEVWRVKLDGRIIASPCIVGGKIWIGTATGYFYCLSA